MSKKPTHKLVLDPETGKRIAVPIAIAQEAPEGAVLCQQVFSLEETGPNVPAYTGLVQLGEAVFAVDELSADALAEFRGTEQQLISQRISAIELQNAADDEAALTSARAALDAANAQMASHYRKLLEKCLKGQRNEAGCVIYAEPGTRGNKTLLATRRLVGLIVQQSSLGASDGDFLGGL